MIYPHNLDWARGVNPQPNSLSPKDMDPVRMKEKEADEGISHYQGQGRGAQGKCACKTNLSLTANSQGRGVHSTDDWKDGNPQWQRETKGTCMLMS